MPFTPAVSPLEPPYEPTMEATLKKWMPPGAPIEPLALFRTLARNRGLMDAMLPLGAYFLGKASPFSLRLREMLILRTCARAACEYEWGVHVTAFASAAELSPDDVNAVTSASANDARWAPSEQAALLACDDIMHHAALSEPVKALLHAAFDEEETIAIMALVSWYRLIATVANSCCGEPEPWGARFPA